MLNYQQQLHSLPVGNPGNFYYGLTGSHSLAVSGDAYAAHNLEPEDKLIDREGPSARDLDKMHRFSVDNLIDMKHDGYAKGKLAMELNNNYGE